MMTPRISIVIPVYNNEKYLPEAVNSVVNQDADYFEVVIVDDGSTDKTAYIADEFAKYDKRIHVVHQDNRWIYGSMNRGVREAKGEYIYILNSDDILYPNSISMMMDVIQKNNVDVIWTRIDEYDHYNDCVRFIRSDKEYDDDIFFEDVESVRRNWPQLYFDHIAVNQANLYRRSLMISHPFREDIYGADVLFNISIADEVKSAYLLKDAVYRFYNYHSEKNNASIGKYYPYEHEMFNEFYTGYINLFEQWGLDKDSYHEKLCDLRIRQVTHEVRSYRASNCGMTDEEKLIHILVDIDDDTVLSCATEYNREWEVESRILSGLRDVFGGDDIGTTEVGAVIGGLLRLRFNNERIIDKTVWKDVIENRYNPRKIGYKYLCHVINDFD